MARCYEQTQRFHCLPISIVSKKTELWGLLTLDPCNVILCMLMSKHRVVTFVMALQVISCDLLSGLQMWIGKGQMWYLCFAEVVKVFTTSGMFVPCVCIIQWLTIPKFYPTYTVAWASCFADLLHDSVLKVKSHLYSHCSDFGIYCSLLLLTPEVIRH